MAKVKITGHASGTGVLTVTAPNTSTDRTITLPDATGTLLNSDGSAANLTAIPAANITGTLPAISGANLTGIGITEADSWRLSSGFSSSVGPISSNLERVDSNNFDKIGTGMTVSSGVFTFPSTGYYLIQSIWTVENTGVDDPHMAMQTTADGGSNWDIAYKHYCGNRESSSTKNTSSGHFILDVTNTSNIKVRFDIISSTSNCTTMGETAITWTGWSFIRLGDT